VHKTTVRPASSLLPEKKNMIITTELYKKSLSCGEFKKKKTWQGLPVGFTIKKLHYKHSDQGSTPGRGNDYLYVYPKCPEHG
jgi:hypothetical protein